MHSLLDWIETTRVARDVADSATLTAWLSAVHVLGFTLVIGSAVVANLRVLGALLPQTAVRDVVVPANRAILVGLAISVATGGLLFSARAVEAAANGTFQLKMLLLILAAAFQFTILRAVAARKPSAARGPFAAGAAGLLLWLGLAVTACAFILLE
jgi:hypothetical protein